MRYCWTAAARSLPATLVGTANSGRRRFGLAWLELASERCIATEVEDATQLAAELERVRPAELLR